MPARLQWTQTLTSPQPRPHLHEGAGCSPVLATGTTPISTTPGVWVLGGTHAAGRWDSCWPGTAACRHRRCRGTGGGRAGSVCPAGPTSTPHTHCCCHCSRHLRAAGTRACRSAASAGPPGPPAVLHCPTGHHGQGRPRGRSSCGGCSWPQAHYRVTGDSRTGSFCFSDPKRNPRELHCQATPALARPVGKSNPTGLICWQYLHSINDQL